MNLSSGINSAILQSMTACATPEPGCCEGSFVFSADFPGFRGHFPGRPILPGVCLLQTVLVLAEAGSGKKQLLSGVRQLKFFRVVQPGEQIECRIAGGRAEIRQGDEKVMLAKLEFA